MRRAMIIGILLVAFQGVSQNVGINTTTPRKTLEVAGDAVISGAIDVRNLKDLQDSDTTTFVKQDPDGSVVSLNVSNPTGAALAYVQEYELVNMDGDWILDFDTAIDADDYVMVPVSSYFNQTLVVNTHTNAADHFSMQYCSTFVRNGTWHIIADYPAASNVSTSTTSLVWKITTLIFSKNLSKQFEVTEYAMNGATTGAATTPILD